MKIDTRTVIGGGIACTLGLVGVLAIVFWPQSAALGSASELVALCKDHEGGSMACYEKEVPKLYPGKSVPEIFEIIREIRRRDPGYQFCHVLAHKLGEVTVAENPSAWIDAIPLNPPDGICSNGFIHGVIVGRFRNDALDDKTLNKTVPDFARACEPRDDWAPTGLDQAICYHGMGHLFMFITNADIGKSLEVCDAITRSPTGNFERVCREGVFMQTYQPLEPDDFALLELLPEKPTRENYRRLCASYDDEDEGACLREAWPLFREDIVKGNVEEFCSGQPNHAEERKCYDSSLTIIGRQTIGNLDHSAAACDAVPRDWQGTCYTIVAQAILEEDRTRGEDALAFCERAPQRIADSCIATIASRSTWLFGAESPVRADFCELVAARGQRCI